jgi:hypothetical protein
MFMETCHCSTYIWTSMKGCFGCIAIESKHSTQDKKNTHTQHHQLCNDVSWCKCMGAFVTSI